MEDPYWDLAQQKRRAGLVTLEGALGRPARRPSGFKSLAPLDRHRGGRLTGAEQTIEWVRSCSLLTTDLTAVEKAGDESEAAGLDLSDPNIGALAEISRLMIEHVEDKVKVRVNEILKEGSTTAGRRPTRLTVWGSRRSVRGRGCIGPRSAPGLLGKLYGYIADAAEGDGKMVTCRCGRLTSGGVHYNQIGNS